jgi:hypothetical protein
VSLQWANRGVDIALCGQSNCQGFSTGAVSALPDTDPLDGSEIVKVKPVGVTFYEDGVAVGAWTNPFGPEVGIASVITNARIHKRGENGTEISTWNGGAGHMVSAAADWVAVGRKPAVLVWFQGEADASDATGTKATNYPTVLASVMAWAKATAGGGMGVLCVRIPVTDLVGYPHAETVRTNTRLWCAQDDLTGRCHAFFDPTSQPWYSAVSPMQVDNLHLNGLGMYRMGKAIGQYLLAQGYG